MIVSYDKLWKMLIDKKMKNICHKIENRSKTVRMRDKNV